MPTDLRTVWEYLQLESDERCVLSAIVRTDGPGAVLVAASLLAGPHTIADSGWPGWRLAEGFHPPPNRNSAGVPSTFVHDVGNALAARATLSQDEAYAWLRSVLQLEIAPAIGGLPECSAPFGVASAPIRVTTHTETVAGRLATWLVRPLVGFHFPAADPDGTPEPPRSWDMNGQTHFSPGIDLLGMSWFETEDGARPSGLLLGRFERSAWLLSQKLDHENDLYAVNIGIEPDRVDPADLVIVVEERVAEEVVFAESLRLDDTDLRGIGKQLLAADTSSGRPVLTVRLPTLGRGVKRSVALFHSDLGLLDQWESFNIVEAISISLDVGSGPQAPITVGERRSTQDLVAVFGAVQRVRSQYADLRKLGALNRVFSRVAEGRPVLRAILEGVRGEVLVVDPWFRDWDLLDGVGDHPPRVLIGAGVPPPPATFWGRVRRWQQNSTPFHDRFFLWPGGGVSVGTSANTFGDRLYRIARLGASESEVLQTQFALWWDDQGFRPV